MIFAPPSLELKEAAARFRRGLEEEDEGGGTDGRPKSPVLPLMPFSWPIVVRKPLWVVTLALALATIVI